MLPGVVVSSPLEFPAFTLGQKKYGNDIQNVQVWRGYDTVTRIASVPEQIKAVVNLRGIIAPNAAPVVARATRARAWT